MEKNGVGQIVTMSKKQDKLNISKETEELFLDLINSAPDYSEKLAELAENAELRRIIVERKGQHEIDVDIDDL